MLDLRLDIDLGTGPDVRETVTAELHQAGTNAEQRIEARDGQSPQVAVARAGRCATPARASTSPTRPPTPRTFEEARTSSTACSVTSPARPSTGSLTLFLLPSYPR